ncbi:MAG: hypothetical protein II369_01635 [Clostridia bacterium]|nr:hypothetical protein [Clostridia bacterium]MBQ1962801.1 hypothetical protein [Clostridia bacterium]
MAALLLGLSALGCTSAKTKQEQRVIGTCAGYDVLYEELRYLTLTYKELFEDTYGEGIWEDPVTTEKYRKELEDTVWDMLLNNYAVLSACDTYLPKKNAIEDEAIQEAVDQMIEEMIASYGSKKEYRKALEAYHTTEHFLRFTFGVAQLENELIYALADDWELMINNLEDFEAWLREGNCVYVQHVYIRNDAGEDVDENRAKAEQARLDLIGAENEEQINEIVGDKRNEDLQPSPYYVVKGVYVSEIEDAAYGLDFAGDVSQVVETEGGFYVLVRMEDSTEILLSKLTSLFSDYQNTVVEDYVEMAKQTLRLELNEYGRSLDLLAIE